MRHEAAYVILMDKPGVCEVVSCVSQSGTSYEVTFSELAGNRTLREALALVEDFPLQSITRSRNSEDVNEWTMVFSLSPQS